MGENAHGQPGTVDPRGPEQVHVAGVEQVAHHVDVDPRPAVEVLACRHRPIMAGPRPGRGALGVLVRASRTS